MTITMNHSDVEKSVLNAAIEKAKKENTNVVIYKAEIVVGKPKVVSSVTEKQFNESPNRHNLEYIQTVQPNGSFVN